MKIFVFIILTALIFGCGTQSADDELGGRYSRCSYMSDGGTNYVFNTDGTFEYIVDDEYAVGYKYKYGKWTLIHDVLELNITKYGYSSESAKDTSDWLVHYGLSHKHGYDCIQLNGGDILCRSGKCLYE